VLLGLPVELGVVDGEGELVDDELGLVDGDGELVTGDGELVNGGVGLMGGPDEIIVGGVDVPVVGQADLFVPDEVPGLPEARPLPGLCEWPLP
jgi:hypothetical protein